MLREEALRECDQVVLVVEGGIGRNIMATAVVRNLKQVIGDKDLMVVASCSDVFLRNPHVRRVIPMSVPTYFYEDYIVSSKTLFLKAEPYQTYDYIYRKKHFVECWCDEIGVACDSTKPELYFSDKERRMAQLYLNGFDKKMVMLQHTGGKDPVDKSEKARMIAAAEMYRRGIREEVTQAITDGLLNRGFMVGSVQHENQFCPSMAEKIQFPVRSILALLPHVEGVIAIDSFLMHGAAAVGAPSLVMWGGTNPKVLGYDVHHNVERQACPTPMCHRPNSYLWDVEPNGYMWECPHNDRCMEFDAEDILREFDQMMEVKNAGRDGQERGERFPKTGSLENPEEAGGAGGPSREADDKAAASTRSTGTPGRTDGVEGE